MSFYDKARSQKFLSFTLILFTLAIGVLIGTVIQTGAKAAKEQQAAADATPLVIPSAVPVQNEFSKIAKRLEPSVVNISTKYVPKKVVSQKSQPRRGEAARCSPIRTMRATTACSSCSSASLGAAEAAACR